MAEMISHEEMGNTKGLPEFIGFRKMPRLSREIIITEKIDGTNGQIYIDEYDNFLVGSRTRWISPEDDNCGFAAWAYANMNCLLKLGPGRHFGEWWGSKIQRGYGIKEKRFSLFYTKSGIVPECCHLVPILYQGEFDMNAIEYCLHSLKTEGSVAAPGFMNPEGVVIYHTVGNFCFKKTIKNDSIPKSLEEVQ